MIAQSFERIHRSNLVGMGVLPLTFEEGDVVAEAGPQGRRDRHHHGLADGLQPRQTLEAVITSRDGRVEQVPLICRIDTIDELEYFNNGGILHYVLRKLAA